MWKIVSEWLLTFLNMTRELEENRASIKRIESRLRDVEEAIKLLAMEQRHTREMESAEREKLLLGLQQQLVELKMAPQAPKKKNRRRLR